MPVMQNRMTEVRDYYHDLVIELNYLHVAGNRLGVGGSVRYGERKRPEHRSRDLLTDAQVSYAPRTVAPNALRFPSKDFVALCIWRSEP